MRRRVKAIVIAAVLILALAVGGPLLYRHFVTDRIVDKDGMINPDYADQQEDPAPVETDDTDQ